MIIQVFHGGLSDLGLGIAIGWITAGIFVVVTTSLFKEPHTCSNTR